MLWESVLLNYALLRSLCSQRVLAAVAMQRQGALLELGAYARRSNTGPLVQVMVDARYCSTAG